MKQFNINCSFISQKWDDSVKCNFKFRDTEKNLEHVDSLHALEIPVI